MRDQKTGHQSRREFLWKAMLAGSAVCIGSGNIYSLAMREGWTPVEIDFEYKYRTLSVRHVKEVKEWFERLGGDDLLGHNEVWRGYVGKFVYDPEKLMPGAKSLIILSIPQYVGVVILQKGDRLYQVFIPSGYFDDLIPDDVLSERVRNEILKSPKSTLVANPRLPLKTLAVKTGLAKYGRNNITYVEGYGSFHRLVGYYTDAVLEDNWMPLRMMKECRGCTICIEDCPTKCIREQPFVINVDRCLPLYNELDDPLPGWIAPNAHNALVGCMRCQDRCPANAEAMRRIEYLAEINAKETEAILRQSGDKQLRASVIRKMQRFPAAEDFAYFSRNLALVLANLSQSNK